VAVELPLRERPVGPVVLTVGNFDGVHRGHRALLRTVGAEAHRRRADSAVVTFDPHPRCVVDARGCPPLLASPQERVQRLRDAGVDHVAVIAFTKAFSRWPAERFCDALLESLDLRALVVGPGFAVGHDRTGDVAFLRRYGAAHGFDVVEARPAMWRGEPVSSSRIREALLDGRPGAASAMLGRVYTLDGRVVRGERIGGRLGFPTANLAPPGGRCVPGGGIYAGWLEVDGAWHEAAVSVGTRPTVSDSGAVTVEAHVLDFDGDLYGRRTRLAFLRRLRGERRFASERALSDAIKRDVSRARAVLDSAAPPA